MSFEDDWLESRYDDINGDPGVDAGDWEIGPDADCDKCGAIADEDCYPDCPYITGEEPK